MIMMQIYAISYILVKCFSIFFTHLRKYLKNKALKNPATFSILKVRDKLR